MSRLEWQAGLESRVICWGQTFTERLCVRGEGYCAGLWNPYWFGPSPHNHGYCYQYWIILKQVSILWKIQFEWKIIGYKILYYDSISVNNICPCVCVCVVKLWTKILILAILGSGIMYEFLFLCSVFLYFWDVAMNVDYL